MGIFGTPWIWVGGKPVTSEASESRDGTGAGDHDEPYRWGNPRGLLTLLAQAHLLLLRSRIRDGLVSENLPPGVQPWEIVE